MTRSIDCPRCGQMTDEFQLSGGGSIRLTPMEFPRYRVDYRFRWTVSAGLAHRGYDNRGDGYCRIAHDDVCPALAHPDLDQSLAEVVRALAVRMRKLIDAGELRPAKRPESLVLPREGRRFDQLYYVKPKAMDDDGMPRVRCAQGCGNSTVAKVEQGWLCSACEKKARKRERTHARWQRGAQP